MGKKGCKTGQITCVESKKKPKFKLHEYFGQWELAAKREKDYHIGVQSVSHIITNPSKWNFQRTMIVSLDHERDHKE